MSTFPELVLRTTLTWRPLLGKLSLFSNWSRLSWVSFSEIFSPDQNVKVFHKEFQVVFLTGEKTWTDLQIELFHSGVFSKCFLTGVDFEEVLVAWPTSSCSNLFTNEYSDLRKRILWADVSQTWVKYFSHLIFVFYSQMFGQICSKTFPFQSFYWLKDFGPNVAYLA